MNKILALLLTLSILFLPIVGVNAKTMKGSVSTSRTKPKEKVSRAKLAAAPLYKEAIKLFQAKNYAGALKCFYELDSTGFCCDMVHYYIGQCYQNTNQTVAAQMHYDWVVSHSRDAQLRSYADYANQTLAYYSSHRTYAGQGNNFESRQGGGGGGFSRSMGFG